MNILASLRGALTLSLIVLNTLFWGTPLLALAAIKLLMPFATAREVLSRALIALAENWISVNSRVLSAGGALMIDRRGDLQLRRREWYLMVSNHRSWVDILVLQAAFNRRVPFLKFFIKDQLKWVPVLGLAWWALDMPFMRRHSREYLEKHPEARGRDLEATRRACEKFRRIPTTVINFVEGTRFTVAKRDAAGAPYRHLLPPRAGGIAFVLGAMGDMLHATLDVTLAYGAHTPSLWDLCCGRLKRVIVHVRQRAIEPWMAGGDYGEDAAFREGFQQGLAAMWAEKDRLLDGLQAELGPGAA